MEPEFREIPKGFIIPLLPEKEKSQSPFSKEWLSSEQNSSLQYLVKNMEEEIFDE